MRRRRKTRRRRRGGEEVERVEALSIKRRGSAGVLSRRLQGESRSCVQLSQREERPSGGCQRVDAQSCTSQVLVGVGVATSMTL